MIARLLFLCCVISLPLSLAAQTPTTVDTTTNALPDFIKLWDYSKPAETEIKFREVLEETKDRADLEYRIELLTQIGRTLALQRKFDEAHRLLDDVKTQLKLRSNSHPSRANLRYELERGRTFNSSNFKAEAIECFNRALDIANELGEENLAVDAAHMLGIATTGDTSVQWNLKAIEMAEAAKDPKAKGWLGPLYNNIGWTFHDKGEYATALDFFERDLKWYEERNLTKESQIARWCIAKMHRLLGDVQKAYDEQTALHKELDNDGYVYEELGECALALGHPETEWKPYFRKALELLSQDPWSVANEAKRHERMRQLVGE